ADARLPGRRRLRDSVRYHALRRRLDQGSEYHHLRGGAARARGGVPLPPDLARHADSHDRGAGLAHRRLRRPVAGRVLDQHADALRAGARHRHRGRRRHRGARERRAPDARERHAPLRGGAGCVALTLPPALCAPLMKRGDHESRVFRPFNLAFAWTTRRFLGGVERLLAHPLLSLLGFAGVLALCVGLFLKVPSSFVPSEDQGYIFGNIQLPDGATLERTRKLTAAVSDIAQKTPGVQTVMGIVGFDLLGGGNKTNPATLFIPLKHWEGRGSAIPAAAVARDVAQKGAQLRDGM